MSLVLNSKGQYEYIGKTRKLKTSNNKIHNAFIELNLGLGEWLFSPDSGHDLKKYLNKGNSPQEGESFVKEAKLYLNKYEPEVVDQVITRSSREVSLEFSEDNDV